MSRAAVPCLWPGSTVVCIGSGPSLTPEDVDYVRGKARVIAVNDNYKLAPWADVLYACDGNWWKKHEGVMSFQGPKYAMTVAPNDWGVKNLRNDGRDGLCLDPTGLRTGKNSGYQAINLAVHLGAARILLLGYDLSKHKGRAHWFGDHPRPLKQNSGYASWCAYFTSLEIPLREKHVTVINCSRRTALDAFPKMALADALPEASSLAAVHINFSGPVFAEREYIEREVVGPILRAIEVSS